MQYFKDKIGSTGLLFLQETHSDSKVEQTWKEDFKGQTLKTLQERLSLKNNKQIRNVVF